MVQGSPFIVLILIARLLGPNEMGIFAIALSIVRLLSIVRCLALLSHPRGGADAAAEAPAEGVDDARKRPDPDRRPHFRLQ